MTVKNLLRKVVEDAVTLMEGQQSEIDYLTNELKKARMKVMYLTDELDEIKGEFRCRS